MGKAMEVSGQVVFNSIVGLGGFFALFVLNTIMGKIDAAKEAGKNAASEVEARVKPVADEAKMLSVKALDKLNVHERHVAEHYISVPRFEGFEKALFTKLDSIEEKLDRKVDKS